MNFLSIAFAFAIAAAPMAARALPPERPPPCAAPNPGATAEALGAIVARENDHELSTCAAADLAGLGAAAVPVAIKLLGANNKDVRYRALEVLKTLGPTASAAVPALIAQVRTPPAVVQEDMDSPLYETIGAIGASAVSAIPLLIARSGEPADAYPSHAYPAIDALGMLGKYEPGTVVPHLIGLLKNKRSDVTVLDALTMIGKPAGAALPATLTSLESAMADAYSMHVSAAVRAIGAIAPAQESVPLLVGYLKQQQLAPDAVTSLALMGAAAAPAVPALIAKLNSSRGDAYLPRDITMALNEIDPGSALVQAQLLVEATQHGSDVASDALARSAKLPASFAPALSAALRKKPDDPFLAKALANTGAGK